MKISKATLERKVKEAEHRGYVSGWKSALDMIDYQINRQRDSDDPNKTVFP